jgi:hypothetical protein
MGIRSTGSRRSAATMRSFDDIGMLVGDVSLLSGIGGYVMQLVAVQSLSKWMTVGANGWVALIIDEYDYEIR